MGGPLDKLGFCKSPQSVCSVLCNFKLLQYEAVAQHGAQASPGCLAAFASQDREEVWQRGLARTTSPAFS